MKRISKGFSNQILYFMEISIVNLKNIPYVEILSYFNMSNNENATYWLSENIVRGKIYFISAYELFSRYWQILQFISISVTSANDVVRVEELTPQIYIFLREIILWLNFIIWNREDVINCINWNNFFGNSKINTRAGELNRYLNFKTYCSYIF